MKRLVAIAEKYIGVKESGGMNKGKEVERFQKTVDGKAQSESWCMSFVQTVCKESGLGVQLYPSEHCLTVWQKTPVKQRLSKPEPGAIVIWQHCKLVEGKWIGTSSGHTGIIKSVTPTHLRVIEGNTNLSGSREGGAGSIDGVYEKIRPIQQLGSLKILGYLKAV